MFIWNLKSKVYRPISLDIGHHSIKMLQLAESDSTLNVVAAEKILIDPAVHNDYATYRSFIISSIKKVLQNGLFHGTECFTVIPNEKIGITNLRLEQSETDKIDSILKREAAERFNLNPEVDSINYIEAGSVRQGEEIKNEYIIFTADSKTISEQIEILEEAKLRPVSIDPIACALFRSHKRFSRRLEDKELTEVFIDVGSLFTTVVFGRGYDISFVKHIGIGTDHFNKEIAARLGISAAEAEILRMRKNKIRKTAFSSNTGNNIEVFSKTDDNDKSTELAVADAIASVCDKLAKEILLCLRYYTVTFRGRRSSRAIFSGGGSYEPALLNIMKNQLEVDIDVAYPLNGMDMSNVNFNNDRRGPNSEWAVAAGLALKGYEHKQNLEPKLAVSDKSVKEFIGRTSYERN